MRIFTGRDDDARGKLEELPAADVYGLAVGRTSGDFPPLEFLKVDGVSRGGNVIVHACRNIDNGPRYEKFGHVALTPAEARGFALQLLAGATLGEGRR